MNAVIVAINARFTHSAPAVLYIRNAIEDAWVNRDDRTVELREYIINQDRLDIIQDIVASAPDILLFSVYIWNGRLAASLLPDLHALLPSCRFVLGGPEVSYSAPDWLARFPFVDMIVSGAGEEAVRQLAAADFKLSPGDSRIVRIPAPDFAAIPLPYRESDLKNLEHRYLYYESSRGCPFSCSYCLSSRDDHGLQSKAPGAVFAEIDTLLAHHPALVKFVDRSFNAEAGRAREIWRHLMDRHAGSGTLFHFEIYPAVLGDEDFTLLRHAPVGLFQFEIGIQSVHPETLAAVCRPAAWQKEKEAIQRLVDFGNIHLHLDLIVGLPYEGIEKVGESFDEIVGLGAEHVQMGFLKGLPGTGLKDQAESFGMVFMREAPYEILRTQWLPVGDLAELGRIATLLGTVGNSHRYDGIMMEVVKRHGGFFNAYRDLSGYCHRTAFDIRTRNEVKVRALLESWNKES